MIDPNKTYRTRDGREVRIYAVDGFGPYPVQGAIKEDGWIISTWTRNGSMEALKSSDYDIIEVKPRHKRTVWLNAYSNNGFVISYTDKSEADRHAWQHRIACIKVELDFEEGEGL